MKEQKLSQFEEFFKTVPLSQRILVNYLCSAIRNAAPLATEEYKHKMLHWKQTTDLIALMAQKDFVFVYFAKKEILERYSEDLGTSLYGKHYLRLKDINDVPFGFEEMLADVFSTHKVVKQQA